MAPTSVRAHLAVPRVARTAALCVCAAGAVLLAAAVLAAWPVTGILGLMVGAILAVAARAPAAGFLAAVALFSFEGSVKVLLNGEGVPFGHPDAVGAGALDLALFGSLVCIVWGDRGRTPRRLWETAGRAERSVLLAMGAWLVLSVVQVFVGGDLSRGIAGLRLTQTYVLCALGGLIIFAPGRGGRMVGPLLASTALATIYAAVRVSTGPSPSEAAYALSRFTTAAFGGSLRAVGSFSGAIGLESFLTPVLGLALFVGLLVPRVRLAAWSLSALAAVGLVGSYGRTPLVALVLAACAGALVLLLAPGSGQSVRRAAGGAIGAVVALAGVAVVLALTGASPALHQRAEGLLHPGTDKSLHLRFQNWDAKLRLLDGHILGLGLGAVGGASGGSSGNLVTTDNSYLKVLLEQGPLGLAAFLIAVLGLVGVVGRRLVKSPPGQLAVGLPSLTGFIAFLVLCVTTDDLEQPGKVIAWTLLGAALASAMCAGGERASERSDAA